MTKFSKEFYVFSAFIRFWALLIAIYLGKDLKKVLSEPTFFYFVSSGLTVFNVRNLIAGSEYDQL